MNITVDSREPSEHPVILEGLGMTVEVKPMLSGDYAWDGLMGRIGLESKSWSNFTTDVDNGVLAYQLGKMVDEYALSILYVHGAPYPKGDPWSYDAFLMYTQLRGVVVVRRDSNAHACVDIARIARTTSEVSPTQVSLMPKIQRRQVLDPRLGFVMGLPGVGPKKAVSLLSAFGNVERLLFAMVDPDGWRYNDLQILLGEKLTKRTIEFITKEYIP